MALAVCRRVAIVKEVCISFVSTQARLASSVGRFPVLDAFNTRTSKWILIGLSHGVGRIGVGHMARIKHKVGT